MITSKKYYLLVGGLACCVIVLVGFLLGLKKSPFSLAQKEMRNLKIAIVDGARIKQQSKPFLYVVKTEQQALEQIYDQMRGRYEDIRKMLEQTKDPKIPIKTRAECKKKFEIAAEELGQEVQKKKEILRQQFAIFTKTLEDAVIQATQDLAKRHGLCIIFNTNVFDTITIFYATPNIDLTDEVIQLIDERLKDLTLPKLDKKSDF